MKNLYLRLCNDNKGTSRLFENCYIISFNYDDLQCSNMFLDFFFPNVQSFFYPFLAIKADNAVEIGELPKDYNNCVYFYRIISNYNDLRCYNMFMMFFSKCLKFSNSVFTKADYATQNYAMVVFEILRNTSTSVCS